MKDEELLKAIREREYLAKKKGLEKTIFAIGNEKYEKILPYPTSTSSKKIGLLVSLCIVLLLAAFFVPYFIFSAKRVVSHDIVIDVVSFDRQAKLEVLSISNTEVLVEKAADNKDAIEAWTQYTGTGVFTVNLKACEFIVDSVRKVVIVRTPNVEVENFTLEYGKTKQLFFLNKYFNDSYKDGADLAQRQLYDAYCKIHDTIISNPHYYATARKSAKLIISSLIKGLNKEIPDLQVIVEVGAL